MPRDPEKLKILQEQRTKELARIKKLEELETSKKGNWKK
jgi:hypothetical protein